MFMDRPAADESIFLSEFQELNDHHFCLDLTLSYVSSSSSLKHSCRERNCRSVSIALFGTSEIVQPDRLRLSRSLPSCFSGLTLEGVDFGPGDHSDTTAAGDISAVEAESACRPPPGYVQQTKTLDQMAVEFQKPIDEIESATAGSSAPANLENFLTLLLAVLERQRLRRGRPENIDELTPKQLVQEKADLQKSLLYFEKVHGRPSDSNERRIMKPLYDRYRHVRRLVRCMQSSKRTKSLSLYRSEDHTIPTVLTTSAHSYTPDAGLPIKRASPPRPRAPEVIQPEVRVCDTIKVEVEAGESSTLDACASESTLRNLSKTDFPELPVGMILDDTSSSLLR
ncbi:unnamed protein product [Dibothriocephalus latus]|uniref:Uncharacterized protein n=1 Tax=Dibothriocephalus latus TaxID=60516 RepID=A0A3P7P3X8_DIBLA|nr:unnamed protein product [Dibothriocephalus latus]